MDCPNLQALYPAYKIVRDAAAGPRCQDPWHWQMPCLFATIYPHGPGKLGVATHSRGAIAKRLAALPCVTVTQDGSDGINAVFRVEDFDRVAAIVKPRKRRRLSEAARLAAIDRIKFRKPQPSAILAA